MKLCVISLEAKDCSLNTKAKCSAVARSLASVGVPTMNIEKQQTTAGAGQDRAEHDYSDFIGSCEFGNEDRAHEVLCLLGYRDHLETLNRALQAQRDELLDAAKWTCCCTGEYLYGDSANPVCDYARKDVEHALGNLKDAIAKCEGGAK